MEGHLCSVQNPRKRSYTAKKESIVQLKMDFANGDFPNRVQFIQRMAQFLVAALKAKMPESGDNSIGEGD